MSLSKPVLLLDKKTVGLVENYIPSDEILEELVSFFSVFSDLTRIKIISALAISEMCVTDLSSMLNFNQTTVSHQLKTLRDIGIVKYRREGKIILYSLKNDILNETLLKGVEFLGF
ncbi:MAG: helix-turn-helix transcriptional regulator [Clostridia bacterium]|nr:helix-turn-helix transcriptional regulator [Clostridia bacterium]